MKEPEIEKPTKVLIIGGGVSGLACAHRLSEAGLPVAVWEKEPYLGGLASSYKVDGLNIPKTYHHILSTDKILLQTMADLGVTIEWKKAKIGLYSQGKVYPLNNPFDILKFKVLPFFDRLRFGFLVLKAKRAKAVENIELKEWAVGNSNYTVYDRLIDPLISAYFGSAEGISAAYLTNRWKGESGWGGGKLGYADVSQIMDNLKAIITRNNGRILTDCEVKSVEKVGNKFKVFSDKDELSVDYLVSTIPAPLLAKIYRELPHDFANELSAIQYKSLICVTYWLPKKSSDYYWLIILDKDSPFVACFEHANLNPHMSHEGMVYAVTYCDQTNPLWQMNDDQIAKLFALNLPNMLPGFGSWKEYKVYRTEWATPIFVKGFRNPPIRTPVENLYIAGISRIFPDIRSMGPAIKTGLEVAEALLFDDRRQGS